MIKISYILSVYNRMIRLNVGDQESFFEEVILELRFEGQRKVGSGREQKSIIGDVSSMYKEFGDRVNVVYSKNYKVYKIEVKRRGENGVR